MTKAAGGRRGLRGRATTTSPTCSTRMDVVPGQGIDFAALGAVLLLVARRSTSRASAVRLAAGLRCSTASCSAPCYRLRADVEDKLHRLPLRYFDRQPRGELLSRVTNDIDNIVADACSRR